MKFISRYITTCPYCHERLMDEMVDNKEQKVCYSMICVVECGDHGRRWEAVDYGN